MPGKGRGLLTKRIVKAGELILEEKADVVLKTGDVNEEVLDTKLAKLSKDKLEMFHNLKGHKDSNLSKFTSNGVQIGDEEFGLFLNIAMVNHSCIPNSGKLNFG